MKPATQKHASRELRKQRKLLPRNLKIITLDIETSPIIAYTWGTFKQFIGLDQIIRDWTILSFCAKTLGSKEIRYHDVSDNEDYYDDHAIIVALWHELDQADIVVTQNGKRFDHKKINARFLAYGMPPPSPYKMVDTLIESRNVAALTSHKLEWMAQALTDQRKLSHGSFPGFKLWAACLSGNRKAWAEMRKYNPQDVIATEAVYLRLRPWIVGHPNVAAYDDDETQRCPKCGSHHLSKRGFTFTQTGKYQRLQCECGAWTRSRYTLNTTGKRKSLLSN